jgi:hypothetical protein
MKNTNIGIANLVISNKLKESYFNDKLIGESKKLTADFLDVVKSSPILQLEFKVFDNLENKCIENEATATRYIDNNIKLFEVYTIDEIDAEREKLNEFLDNGVTLTSENALLNPDKIELYEAIDNLIRESLNDYDKIDVDNIHESFEIVLNHIKTPKNQEISESQELKYVDEDVIEIAINKFNEKYESLNEDDKNLLKKLIKSNDKEKQELFEEYRVESLNILERVEGVKTSEDKEKIANAIRKIKEMKFNSKTIDDDIVKLYGFKKELL